MQFSTIVASLFAATAMAVPASNRGGAQASTQLQQLQAAGGCNILGCIAALGPVAVTCAAAIAEEGINVPADLACIASAINDVANPPSSCNNC